MVSNPSIKEKRQLFHRWLIQNMRYAKLSGGIWMINTEGYGYSVRTLDGKVHRFEDTGTSYKRITN